MPVLGCELWMENFDSMFALVKEYIIDLWKVRKDMENHALPSLSLSPQLGIRGMALWLGRQRRGKFGKVNIYAQGE